MRVITESGRENEGLAGAAPHRSKTSCCARPQWLWGEVRAGKSTPGSLVHGGEVKRVRSRISQSLLTFKLVLSWNSRKSGLECVSFPSPGQQIAAWVN